MRILSFTIALIVLVGLAVAWITPSFHPTPIRFVVPKGWPQPVYDFKNNLVTAEGFTLGRTLFYDGRLSRDGNFSCASCHQQFAAFATYEHNLSHGFNNSLTERNAPALQNLAWQKEFMWDGGINHLDVQPIAPITNEHEMAETLGNVINKLKRDTMYQRLFYAAFGDATINTQRMLKALSQFMLMMVSSNSKYDKVMRGEAAFLLSEQLGYNIFKSKCASCHKEPFFTDFSYRDIGMPMDEVLKDEGRKKISGLRSDSLKFRVPSLRNVAVTDPYGHDGRFFSLMNVFEHYRKNMQPDENTDSLLQHKLSLSNFEIGQLTAFLRTLTDTSFITDTRFAPPGYSLMPPQTHVH